MCRTTELIDNAALTIWLLNEASGITVIIRAETISQFDRLIDQRREKNGQFIWWIIFQTEIPNIICLQLLKAENFLLFLVFHYN